MKQTLIRLTSESNDGNFDNTINDTLLNLKPGSQIALQSASFKRKVDFLVVNPQNNKISFQLNVGNTKDIFMLPGTYTNNNLEELLQNIDEQFNELLSINNGHDFGTEIEIEIDNDERISFDFSQGRQLSLINNFQNNITEYAFFKNIDFDGAGGGKRISRDANAPLTGLLKDCFIATTIPFTKSCGILHAGVFSFNNVNPTVQSGFVIGLLQDDKYKKIQGQNPTITENDLEFAIRTGNQQTQNYQFKVDAQGYQDAGHAPDVSNNGMEYVAIQFTEGNLQLGIYKQGANAITQFGTNIDRKTIESNDYYVVIGCRGTTATNQLTDVSFTEVPYIDDDQEKDPNGPTFKMKPYKPSVRIQDTPAGTLGVVPQPNIGPVVPKLIFQTLEVAQFFGFHRKTLNRAGDSFGQDERMITARNKFLATQTNTYLVELLNLNLESYDGLKGGRKNILATIPVAEKKTDNYGEVGYSANYPNYINLTNKNEISLRNIRARLITDEFDPVVLEGLAQITMLIQEHC